MVGAILDRYESSRDRGCYYSQILELWGSWTVILCIELINQKILYFFQIIEKCLIIIFVLLFSGCVNGADNVLPCTHIGQSFYVASVWWGRLVCDT